jgi:hypothetical protein
MRGISSPRGPFLLGMHGIGPQEYDFTSRAIALSEKEYKEPLRYWPERFLNENLNNPLQGHWGFGPGPLACRLG